MQLDIAQALKSEPYTNEQMEEFFDFDVECHCCGAKSRYKNVYISIDKFVSKY